MSTSFLYTAMTKQKIEEKPQVKDAQQDASDKEALRLIGQLLLPDLPLILGCLFVLCFCAMGFLVVPLSIGESSIDHRN